MQEFCIASDMKNRDDQLRLTTVRGVSGDLRLVKNEFPNKNLHKKTVSVLVDFFEKKRQHVDKETLDFIPIIVFHCASLKGIRRDSNGNFGLTIKIPLFTFISTLARFDNKILLLQLSNIVEIKNIVKHFNRLVKHQHMQFHIYISILFELKVRKLQSLNLTCVFQ